MSDRFDSLEFYELLEVYRQTPVHHSQRLDAALEAVKEFARSTPKQGEALPLDADTIDGLLLAHRMMDQWPTQNQIHGFVRNIEANIQCAPSVEPAPTEPASYPPSAHVQWGENVWTFEQLQHVADQEYQRGYAHGIRFADENLTGKDIAPSPSVEPAPTTADTAPIAKINVHDGRIILAEFYAPGLPDGEHDLWPVRVTLTEEDEALAKAAEALVRAADKYASPPLQQVEPGWVSNALQGIETACNYSPHREANTWDEGLAKLIHHHARLLAAPKEPKP